MSLFALHCYWEWNIRWKWVTLECIHPYLSILITIIIIWLKSVGNNGNSLIIVISWWRWWFEIFRCNSHKVTIEFIAMLGNKILITNLKWNDFHNEGEKESFIPEVGTLGLICILKAHQNACQHMNTTQIHLFTNGYYLVTNLICFWIG